MQDVKKKIVAEYDPIDGIFHIQTLGKTIEGNFRCVLEGRAHRYLLMGVFDDYHEANQFCDAMRKELKRRVAV